MSYRLDSDVVVPYGRVTPITEPHNVPPVKDYWASKSLDKLAAWMVSHCGTASRREWYVKELIRYIKVDVYGRCGRRKCGKNLSIKTVGTFNQEACNTVINQYMFYLAFENAICESGFRECHL
ncbi:alpha-(1,3)-fucosyltransferase C-like [Panulirus ornatus]|uniref:alpha-(1,3)-fucosyltransferase C-like n=1 Tax=Panulirus ornatus TaxID=150431 RepID=UPI003A8548AC